MRSRFARHALFWLILPLVLVLSLPAVPEYALFDISAAERAANSRLMGAAAHREIERRTQERFNALFVRSGIVRFSFKMFGGAEGRRQVIEGARDRGASAGYLQRVWLAVFKAVYRVEVAMRWFAAAGIVLLASFIDGVARRNIKSYEFGYANPVAFHFSAHGLLVTAGLLFVVPFVPFSIQEWTWPVLIGMSGIIIWKVAESYQSSI